MLSYLLSFQKGFLMNIIKLDQNFQRICFLGDVHGLFKELDMFLKLNKPNIVLQCGDFGYWPKFFKDRFDYLKDNPIPIYFCDGNHEDYESLKNIECEVYPNIYYMKRTKILNINNLNIMFIGGAESIDGNMRTLGYDYFLEESISQKDFINLPDTKIDIIISHTCPMEVNIKRYNEKQSSRIALSYILEMYQPKLWYFGHYHSFKEGNYKNTKWFCLDMLPRDNCFIWLK